jgi:capsid portal protein
MEFINDEVSSNDINISNAMDWALLNKEVVTTNDPFAMDIDSLKKVGGLSTSFKRKMNREFTKRFSGIDGTATQQNLLAQAITGYAMFDLIEPPYNLDYLSRVYELSTYNYSAVNAKVSNIVGLGYDFVETRKTNEAFDSITDDKQLERARKKLNRLRQDLSIWLDETNEEELFIETLKKAYTDLEVTGNGYIEVGRTTNGNIGYI